jgi:hypothetical protein
MPYHGRVPGAIRAEMQNVNTRSFKGRGFQMMGSCTEEVASMQEAERIQTEIQKVIADDPTIQDSSRIIVMVEKRSFWKGGKETVVLTGSVRSESDKVKVERIAQQHAAGRQVQDSLVVH